jgi:Uma2 family endonuclease
LIDGVLIRKDRGDEEARPMSHGPRHGSAVVGLQESLSGVKTAGCHLRVQLPVTAAGIQEPEPDVSVIRGTGQQFTTRHPGPEAIVALMEVADSSLNFDRTTKQRLYANAAIPIYWIVNLVDQQIEVYLDPQISEGKYAHRTDYGMGQTVALAIGPSTVIEVAVADVIPG